MCWARIDGTTCVFFSTSFPKTVTLSETGIFTSWKLPESVNVTLNVRSAATSTVWGVDGLSVTVLLPVTASVLTSMLPCRPLGGLPPVFAAFTRW